MKPKTEEVQKLIDSLIEGLSYASYDINPAVNRPVDLELMLKIQEVVISDINSLSEIAETLNKSFAEIHNPPMKPLSELISVRVPTESDGYFINSVGCLRYTHNQGRESSVIEPLEIGVYLEKDRHEIIGTSIFNNQKIVIIYDVTPETK